MYLNMSFLRYEEIRRSIEYQMVTDISSLHNSIISRDHKKSFEGGIDFIAFWREWFLYDLLECGEKNRYRLVPRR